MNCKVQAQSWNLSLFYHSKRTNIINKCQTVFWFLPGTRYFTMEETWFENNQGETNVWFSFLCSLYLFLTNLKGYYLTMAENTCLVLFTLRFWVCLALKSNLFLKTVQRLFALLDLLRITSITAVPV